MAILFFLSNAPEPTTCTGFDSFIIKGVRADNEKIVLVVQNKTAGSVNGLQGLQLLLAEPKEAAQQPLQQSKVS